jgi:hypothetical protein
MESEQPRDKPFIVIHYMFAPQFMESHIITYDPVQDQYDVDTIEILRRNASDTHRESHNSHFRRGDEITLFNHICKYLPPTHASYLREGYFYIRDEEACMHTWRGYINNDGTQEDAVNLYLHDVRRDDLQVLVNKWLWTLLRI